jgi:hypothetical protein
VIRKGKVRLEPTLSSSLQPGHSVHDPQVIAPVFFGAGPKHQFTLRDKRTQLSRIVSIIGVRIPDFDMRARSRCRLGLRLYVPRIELLHHVVKECSHCRLKGRVQCRWSLHQWCRCRCARSSGLRNYWLNRWCRCRQT